MDRLDEAKLLAALLGVLKKESSKVREDLLEELHQELKDLPKELTDPLVEDSPEFNLLRLLFKAVSCLLRVVNCATLPIFKSILVTLPNFLLICLVTLFRFLG